MDSVCKLDRDSPILLSFAIAFPFATKFSAFSAFTCLSTPVLAVMFLDHQASLGNLLALHPAGTFSLERTRGTSAVNRQFGKKLIMTEKGTSPLEFLWKDHNHCNLHENAYSWLLCPTGGTVRFSWWERHLLPFSNGVRRVLYSQVILSSGIKRLFSAVALLNLQINPHMLFLSSPANWTQDYKQMSRLFHLYHKPRSHCQAPIMVLFKMHESTLHLILLHK